MIENKAEQRQLNLINAICTLGIATFHYAATLEPEFIPFVSNANARWGATLVSCFFVISGYKLYFGYNTFCDINQVFSFYYKRWRRLFPAFYLAFAYYYLRSALVTGTLNFRKDNPVKLVFTLFGMDGYAQSVFGFTGYHMVGEWFLGAIILVYLLYPIVLIAFNRFGGWTLVAFVFMALAVHSYMGGYISIFSCYIPFLVGMLFRKIGICSNKWFQIVSFIVFLLLMIIRIPIDVEWGRMIINHLTGIVLFTVLFAADVFVKRTKLISVIFDEVNRVSFGIYLFQTNIATNMSVYWPAKGYIDSFIKLICVILLSYVCGKVLTVFCNYLYGTNCFRRMDNFFGRMK